MKTNLSYPQGIFFGLGFSVSKPGARDRASENVMRTLRSREVASDLEGFCIINESPIERLIYYWLDEKINDINWINEMRKNSLKDQEEGWMFKDWFNTEVFVECLISGRMHNELVKKTWFNAYGLAKWPRIGKIFMDSLFAEGLGKCLRIVFISKAWLKRIGWMLKDGLYV